MGEQVLDFLSKEEEDIYGMVIALKPTWEKASDIRLMESVDLKRMYSEAKKVYVEKGKEAFVKYVKTFPDSVIFQFWYYLFGTGLSVRAEHMPKDYLKNEK